jgi:acetoin utilization protein AcuB
MFHLFTIEGKRLYLPLENIKPNLRVDRAKKNYRSRTTIKADVHRVDERLSHEGAENLYGKEAYRQAARVENMKERVFYASEIMSSPVITVDPGITAAEAWNRFSDYGFRHMPVVSDEGAIIGILSERDLLKQLIIRDGKVADAVDISVRDIMSRDVIATGPQTDIRRVARAMLEQHLGIMPVIDDKGVIAGVVTRSDILNAIIHHPSFSLWA